VDSDPVVQRFEGGGFVDVLRSTSMYRRLDGEVREPLLRAITEPVREHIR
jgi:hypothetical protein